MFVCIEMTSRKLWCEIVQNKKSESSLPVFRRIIREVTADAKYDDSEFGYICADDGGEWSQLKKLCEGLKIPWRVYTGENKSRKMALVERANRQVKDRIRAFQEPTDGTAKPRNAWKAQLSKFISGYNATLHSTIGMTPNKAYEDMGAAREHLREREPDWDKERFDVGDAVRVKVYKDNIFEKKVNTWSREVFTVSAITETGIEVEGGSRPFQRYELLKIPKGAAWKAPTREVVKAHKESETAEQKASRLRAVEKEIGPVIAIEPRVKTVIQATKKPISLVRKAYEVVGHRGKDPDFELEVSRKVRAKVEVAWFPLSSFIHNGGIDEIAFNYIKSKRLVKASGI